MTGTWSVSPDGAVGALRGQESPWVAGKPDIKTPWLRPPGATLRIDGRRLDGASAPLRARVPAGYAGEFQVSGLTFPTPGCWEVDGRAGGGVVRLVAVIPPGGAAPG